MAVISNSLSAEFETMEETGRNRIKAIKSS